MSLLSSEDAEQQEVREYVYLWITADNTPRPESALRGSCARNLESVFWVKSSKSFEPSHHHQMHKLEKAYAFF
jgi:hypothetical protein